MAIFARPADTQPGPTLMGWVLPGPIKNRVGYGLKKKNPKRVRVGSGYEKTRPEPDPLPFLLGIPNFLITKITLLPN